MAPRTDSVCVTWVHSNEIAYSFFASVLNLQTQILTSERNGRWLAMRYGSGGITEARNKAAAEFLAGDEDWLMWVDTDMGFEPQAIDELLDVADATERPVVGGLCFANREVAGDGRGGFATFPIPTIYLWAQQPDGTRGFISHHDYPRDELVPCDATGSAFILIHRSALETIGDNWYGLMANPNGGAFSEDLSFCVRCAEHDIPIHVHTGVKTTHYKPVWLSELHFDMHRSMAEQAGVSPQAMTSPTPLPKNRAERRRRDRAKAS